MPVELATIIVGRDLLLSLSALYIRYTSLPHPVSYTTLPCVTRVERP
jgi:cardiolipin synthase (CMP-forming)